MVQEAGGYVITKDGTHLRLPLNLDQRMSFIATSNETLAHGLLCIFKGM